VLIRTYGLFWQRSDIDWGAGRRRGHLNGYYAFGKREGITDFREQRGIYCLYDPTFKLVYVGQAGNGDACLFDRLRDHARGRLAQRWSQFSWFGTRGLIESSTGVWTLDDDQEAAPSLATVLNQLEGILIAAAEPPLNRQGSRFGSDCYLYNQVQMGQSSASFVPQ